MTGILRLTLIWLIAQGAEGITDAKGKYQWPPKLYPSPDYGASLWKTEVVRYTNTTAGAIPNPNKVRIGTAITLDRYTKYSALGGAMKSAWMIFFDWLVRKQGGVKINGVTYDIELTFISDNSSATEVPKITDYLLNTLGLRILLAPYSSGLTKLVAPKINATGGVMIAAGSSAGYVFKGRPTVFGTLTPAAQYMTGAIKLLGMADGGKNKTMAVVYEDVKWTKGVCAKVPALLGAHGIKMINTLGDLVFPSLPDDELHSRPVIENLTKLNPDIVTMCTYRESCFAMLRQMKKMKFYAKAILTTICVDQSDFIPTLASAGYYILGVTPWVGTLQLESEMWPGWTPSEFEQQYKLRNGKLPPYQAASAFGSVAMLIRAIQDANSTDPLQIAAVLKDASYGSMYGRIAFDANGQCTNEMKVVQGQAPTGTATPDILTVYPPGDVNGQLEYPKPSWDEISCKNVDESDFTVEYGYISGVCTLCAVGKISTVERLTPTKTERQCVDCPKGRRGYIPDGGVPSCQKCDAGSYTSEVGKAKCTACAPGTFQGDVGATACSNCVTGFFGGEKSLSECSSCVPGQYSATVGSTQCATCDVGKFASKRQSSKCDQCGAGQTKERQATMTTQELVDVEGVMTWTFLPGAANSSKCGCKEGYMVTAGVGSDVVCEKCGRGLQCNGGEYRVKTGYYTKVEATPYIVPGVYLCEPQELCTGSKKPYDQGSALCVGERIGFMCTKCAAGYITTSDYEDNDNFIGCKECAVSMELYLIVGCVFALVFLVFQLREAKESPLLESPVKVEIQNTAGMGLMFMQILGAIQSANLEFGEPTKTFLLGLIQPIDMSVAFQGVPCISAEMDNAVQSFAAKISLPAIFAIAMLTIYFIVTSIRKGVLMFDGLLNCLGEILIEFYVSITIAVLGPFNCYDHPNGQTSMFNSPEIVCYEGKHIEMITLSVVGALAYTINCLVITFFATYWHPRSMARGDIGLLVRCEFLFKRWRPESYWFCTVVITRNCLIAFWPMVIPEKDLACLFMALTLIAPTLAMASNQPRRTPGMNYLDGIICGVQLVVLAVGSMTVYTKKLDTPAISWICCIFIAIVLVLTGLLLSIKGCQLLFGDRAPLSWCFDAFLDHHGGSGVSAARMVYILLSCIVRRFKLFYDLDVMINHRGLGVIMDAGKLSKHAFTILSNDTWCRTWCVGALSGIFNMKVPISVVNFGTHESDFSYTISTRPSMLEKQTGMYAQSDTEGALLPMLLKQVPTQALRPMGVGDENILQTMKEVLSAKPKILALFEQMSVENWMGSMLEDLAHCPPGLIRMESRGTVVESIFSKVSLTVDDGQDSILITCDHSDIDGLGISRLIYLWFNRDLAKLDPSLHLGHAGHGRVSAGSADSMAQTISEKHRHHHGSLDAIRKFNIIQDIDLSAVSFAKMVADGKVHANICTFTATTITTLKATEQFLRLGYIHEYCPIQIRSYPIVVDDKFSYPGAHTFDLLEEGRLLDLGGDPPGTSIKYTTKTVSLSSVRYALEAVLHARITICDVPRAKQPTVDKAISKILRIISSDMETPVPLREAIPGPQTPDYGASLVAVAEPENNEEREMMV